MQSVKQPQKRIRKSGCEYVRLARQRMDEAYFVGMKGESSRQLRQFRAVKKVTSYRAAHVRHVNADLMCATGFQFELHQRAAIPLLKDFITRGAGLPFRGDNPAYACGVLFADRRIDDSAILGQATFYHREINPPKVIGVERALEKMLAVCM